MEPGAVVSQWIPTYNRGVNDTWSMIRTFVEVFPHALLFMNGDDGIIIGSNAPLKMDPSIELPDSVISDLKRSGSVYAAMGNFICSRDRLLEASRDYPLITDDFPILEFTSPISHWEQDVSGPIEMRGRFLDMIDPIENILTGNVDWERARRFREGRILVNKAFLQEKIGFIGKAHSYFQRAYELNPEDERVVRLWFIFLRRNNRLGELPDALKHMARPVRRK